MSSSVVELNARLLAPSGRIRGFIDRTLVRTLKEERDLPVFKFLIQMAVVLWSFAAALYVWGSPPWWLLLGYCAAALIYTPPYILALHVSSHRGVFKPGFRWLQTIAVWLLGPFAGQSPETYRVHHMGMHHTEGNMPDDLSSTMAYKRDEVLHFAHYFGRFFFFVQLELGLYHARRGHWRLLRQLIVGEASYLACLGLLLVLNPSVTLAVFVFPLLLARVGMMCGNWAQHAFIDASDPANPYRNSITCIDSPYNRRCFNDGFHIGHHVKPNRHWSEMAEDFLRNRSRYEAEGAIVFRGLDYFEIWVLLMLKKHRVLARRLVTHASLSEDQRDALIRSRLLPVRLSD
ncbi:MAG: fatty acid desaturase [Myxococcales bacterium]|nr:fatty acid desaturase [Myxococcales bacterium]